MTFRNFQNCRKHREFFYDNRRNVLSRNPCPGCADGRTLCPARTTIQQQQNKLLRQTAYILNPIGVRFRTFEPRLAIAKGGNYSIHQLASGNVRPKSCNDQCCC